MEQSTTGRLQSLDWNVDFQVRNASSQTNWWEEVALVIGSSPHEKEVVRDMCTPPITQGGPQAGGEQEA